MTCTPFMAAVLISAVTATTSLHAQSLADVAKAEAERRAAIEAKEQAMTTETPAKDSTDTEAKGTGGTAVPPTRVYTNKNLPAPAPAAPSAATVPGAAIVAGAATPLITDPTKEPYWRERRRVIDARLHDDQMASKAATDLFLTMQKTGIMRLDPAAYVKAMNDMKQKSDAVSYDVEHLVPDFYAEGRRAGVPEEWLRPSDRQEGARG